MMKLTLALFLSVYFYCCFGQLASPTPKIAKIDSGIFNLQERFHGYELTLPLALLSGGVIFNGNHNGSLKNEIAEERNKHMPNFRTYVDDYLQFSPIAAAYGLDAIGYGSRTDIENRTLILIKGELAMFGITQLMKRTIGQRRPDGSNNHSFPSGHTAQAFAAATFLSEEYSDRFRWMPYMAYGVASSVGAFRIANNKHFVSDVLVGAAIGILTMKASYWSHRYLFGSH